MNAIAYSIFGWNNRYDSCFEHRSYLRGLHLNIRVTELLYPGWTVCVMTDEATYNSPYKSYYDALVAEGKIDLHVLPTAPLCTMMLYRLYPIYLGAPKSITYKRVLCRDTDSLLSYRERQAVAYWESGPKMAHAITDSISHTIDLMGGMVGFQSGPFRDRLGPRSWPEFLDMVNGSGLDFNRKGADQDFLGRHVYPRVADSITQHYILGRPQSFMGDCHNTIADINVGPEYLRDMNGYAFHIGASGFQTDAVVKMLNEHGVGKAWWSVLEQQFPEVFYWKL